MLHPADADISRLPAHIPTCNYHSQHTCPPRTKWEPAIPNKHCVLQAVLWMWGLIHPSFLHLSVSFLLCLVIKRHYEACHEMIPLHRGVFDPSTFHHSTGRKWDGVMMNVVNAYFTLMSSRVTVALSLPRRWVWRCLKIELVHNEVAMKERERGI